MNEQYAPELGDHFCTQKKGKHSVTTPRCEACGMARSASGMLGKVPPHPGCSGFPDDWVFEGDMVKPKPSISIAVTQHPLYPVFVAAIEQAMYGKGERHGGAVTPFFEQPWAHYAQMHGRGFLTGQSAKKLEEAASLRAGDAFVAEVLGAIVYAGMAVLTEQKHKE